LGFNSVERIHDLVALRHVLVSVFDKTGLPELVLGLARECPGIEFYSTGGTHSAIAGILSSGGAGLKASLRAISDYTGQAEMAGGLVKTLDWRIYLGLLAEEGNASHEGDLARHGAVAFDAVVGNLYPFEAAAGEAASTVEDLRQRIDIGGPAMLRAAAKNFLRVASVSSPAQYQGLLAEVRAQGGSTRLSYRRTLAAEAFGRISAFDAAIARRFSAVDEGQLKASYLVE
jgi:phosphoribosylaminoimidazolecarboxamide formyltransferase/IMP cyclohydrolase